MQSESQSTNATSSSTPTQGALHQHFLAILPRIETHAQIHFRYLRCPGKREDAIAEVIAVAWKWFLRATEMGKNVSEFVSALADFAVRHVRQRPQAVQSVEGQGRVLTSRPASRRLPGLASGLLDGPQPRDLLRRSARAGSHGRDGGPSQGQYPESRARASGFPHRLSGLAVSTRGSQSRIAQDMTLDLGTFELAEKHGVSPGRISQMRREFVRDWERFHTTQPSQP